MMTTKNLAANVSSTKSEKVCCRLNSECLQLRWESCWQVSVWIVGICFLLLHWRGRLGAWVCLPGCRLWERVEVSAFRVITKGARCQESHPPWGLVTSALWWPRQNEDSPFDSAFLVRVEGTFLATFYILGRNGNPFYFFSEFNQLLFYLFLLGVFIHFCS